MTMQITCSICGNACEVDGELSIGQHLVCPFCSQTFSYSGVKQEDESVSRDIQREEDIHEVISVKCPYCGTEYEVDKSSEGVTCQCTVCNKEFVAKRFVLPRRRKQRISISADSLRSMGAAGVNRLSEPRNARSRVLMILGALLVAGGLGVLIYKTMENSKGGTTNDSAETTNVSAGAKNISPEEQYNLGTQYYKGEGVTQDKAEAVRLFRKAAEQGLVKAQTILGLCYGMGEGVSQDQKEAVRWFRKAADAGDAEAQFHLAKCYAQGIGVEQDSWEAAKWYRKAAEQGHAESQFSVGILFYAAKNFPEAILWFSLAARQGHAEAQLLLGGCYHDGNGVEKDWHEAVKWYQKSAAQGLAEAQCRLGLCYSTPNNLGVDLNPHEAMKWFRKAAEQGNARAQFFLGLGYIQGIGVATNRKEGIKWLRRAAAQDAEYARAVQKILQ